MKNDQSYYFNPNKSLMVAFSIYLVLGFYEGYLNQWIGSVTKYYLIFIMSCFLVSYKKIRLESYHYIIILWLVLKLVSVIWIPFDYQSNDIVQAHFLSQIGMVALFVTMTIVKFEKKSVAIFTNIMMITSFSMGVLGLFFSESENGSLVARQVLTLFGTQIDSNNLAALYLVGVAIALYKLFNESKRDYRLIVLAGINIYSISLTASRGGFLSLLAIIIFFILFSNTKKTRVRNMIKKMIVIILMCMVLYWILSTFLPKESFDRIFVFDTYEGGSGRSEIWEDALRYIIQRPLFGYGWGFTSGAHNTYLTMVLDVGFIGTFLFFLAPCIVIIKSIKNRNILVSVVLITGLLPSTFVDAINKAFFWNAIIMSTIMLQSEMYKLHGDDAHESYG